MSKKTGHLWGLIEDWMETLQFKPSQSQLAERVKVSRSTISEWKYGTSMPKPLALERLSDETRIPYRRLLAAAHLDAGYDPDAHERRRTG